MNVPRLKPGKGVKGPEPYGCFNSGAAPVILACSDAMDFTHKKIAFYVVGPEHEVRFCKMDYRIYFIRHPKARSCKVNSTKVYKFKTRRSAVAKFKELCDKMNEWNRAEAGNHQELLSKAKAGDAKAALDLADYQ